MWDYLKKDTLGCRGNLEVRNLEDLMFLRCLNVGFFPKHMLLGGEGGILGGEEELGRPELRRPYVYKMLKSRILHKTDASWW